jgi:signal transduction histidine kinase
MLRFWSAFRRLWESDSGLSLFLLLLLVLIFLVPVAGLAGPVGRLVVDAFFTLLMLSGVMSVSNQKGPVVAVSIIAIVGLLIRWFGRFAPSEGVEVATTLSAMVGILTLGAVVLAQVFKAGAVTTHRVMGAIAAYLLLGLAWGQAYYALAIVDPGAFKPPGTDAGQQLEWVYYSFVTLTTVGYGDITPVAPLARSLAVFEALTGQLYPAILLARLVALEVGARAER